MRQPACLRSLDGQQANGHEQTTAAVCAQILLYHERRRLVKDERKSHDKSRKEITNNRIVWSDPAGAAPCSMSAGSVAARRKRTDRAMPCSAGCTRTCNRRQRSSFKRLTAQLDAEYCRILPEIFKGYAPIVAGIVTLWGYRRRERHTSSGKILKKGAEN